MNGAIRGQESHVEEVLAVRTEAGEGKEATAVIPATVHQVPQADLARHPNRQVRHQRRVASAQKRIDQRTVSRCESQSEQKVEAHLSSDVIHLQVGSVKFILRHCLLISAVGPPARPRLLEKKAASPIPSLKRKKPNTPPLARPERNRTSNNKKKRDSSSGSGSTSGSGSETSYSSSTSDSKGKKKREKIVVERKASAKGKKTRRMTKFSKVLRQINSPGTAEMTKKRATPAKDDKKDKASSEKAAAAAKMKSTRREELLKQLKAVEDAIARKKSKI